jgi:hypothetical protein
MRRRRDGPSREKLNAILGREDPLDHFCAEVERLVGIRRATTTAHLDSIRSALGLEWFETLTQPVAASAHRPVLADDGRHPLARWICLPNRSGMLRTLGHGCDLAVVRGLRAFDVLASMLRDAEQFDRARIHAALAARLSKIAGGEVELEPVTAGGRSADIAVTFQGVPFLVELYRPDWPRATHLDLWEISLKKALGEMGIDVVVVAKLHDEDRWSGDERVQFQDAMKRAATRAAKASDGHGEAEIPSRASFEAFAMTSLSWAERAAFLQQMSDEQEPIAGVHMLSSKENELLRVVRGEPVPRRYARAGLLCTAPVSVEERACRRERAIERVLRSVAQKAPQLRHSDERVEGVLMIEPGWLGGDTPDLLDGIARPLIERHPEVRAVVLVDQSKVEPLLEYSGRGTSPASEALLRALREAEHTALARLLNIGEQARPR